MLAVIIEKELRDIVLNLRFVAASALSIVLIVVTMLTLVSSYRQELAEYNGSQAAQEDFISHYGHVNRWGWMSKPLRPPAGYAYVVRGIDAEARQENFVSNPLPVLFSQIDLVAIVTIIMSLMAVLFSYNAISGEREGGMLKLMLSSDLPRSTLLAGKFISGTLSLVLSCTIGLLAGLLVTAANPDVELRSADLGVFLLLLLASYLYIAAFYALGLMLSARSRSSNVALLKGMFAWVVLALMLPNISPFLAAELYRIPSKTKVDMETWEVQGRERDNIINQKTKELLATRYADIAAEVQGVSNATESDVLKKKSERDPVFRERYQKYTQEWITMVRAVNEAQQAKISKIRAAFEARSKQQERLARVFASASPLADYVFIVTDLADAGMQADDTWDDQKARYNAQMNPLLEKLYDDEVKRNPSFTVNDYIDMRAVPRFAFHPPGLWDKIDATVAHFGLLALFVVVFLAGAWVSVLNYDIR